MVKRQNTSHAVVDSLHKLAGIDTVFSVPGIPLTDFLGNIIEYPEMERINNRTEGGAAWAAHGVAQLSGIGVAAVTQGVGVGEGGFKLGYMSQQHPAPVLIMVGQAPEAEIGNLDKFQSIDCMEALRPLTKSIMRIGAGDQPENIIRKAVIEAQAGIPGAVAVEMPIDIMSSPASDGAGKLTPPKRKVVGITDEGRKELEKARTMIAEHTPVFIIGDQFRHERFHNENLVNSLNNLLDKTGGAVGATHSQQDQFPNSDYRFVGNYGYNCPSHVKEGLHKFKLPILLGAPPDQTLTSDTKNNGFDNYWKNVTFALIHPDRKLLDFYSSKYPNMIAIHSDIEPALTELATGVYPSAESKKSFVQKIHDDTYNKAYSTLFPGTSDISQVTSAIATATKDENVIYVLDSGDFATSVGYGLTHKNPHTRFSSSPGFVGYSIPAAVGIAAATKVRNPENPPTVFAITGDSGVFYAGSELATAQEHNLNLKVLVMNDGRYNATERTSKDMGFTSKIANELSKMTNVDFAKVAEGYKVKGYTVDGFKNPSSILEILKNDIKSNEPALIDIKVGHDKSRSL